MAILDPAYAELLRDYDLTQLDRHEGAIYVLCDDWRLRYFNDGWSRFAQDNGGEPALSQRYPLGAPVFDAFSPPALREFFQFHYRQCRAEARPWSHDYECSSAHEYRRFRQFVYPLKGEGVMVVNSKRVARPRLELPTSVQPAESDYRDGAGLVHQCAHCRRIRSAANHDSWDWIPAWVAHMPRRCSHGLCPHCLVYYYLAPSSPTN
jgi:hypothetical protein